MELTKINGKYDLWLPEHRANRPEWYTEYGWEKKRMEQMCSHLIGDDVLFYCGAEEGDLAAVLVKETGCDIVLFEPNNIVWPCIKSIWQANQLKQPLDFFRGFVSDKTTITDYKIKNNFFDIDVADMIPAHGFRQLYEHSPEIPQITIDDYCQFTGIFPSVITADVEGSEFGLLRGAEKTLKEKKPIVFLSVHPVFMWEHYREETGVMLKYMRDLGYKWSCIDYDIHEHHLIFYYE